ncbi:MAG: hypothetical protein U9O20_04265 [Patescibacteria group bacterium]|nr:hypothetical protein [Patescibacteria group bacterium]
MLALDQTVLINNKNLKEQPIKFIKTVFHELMHLKGHLSIEAQKLDGKITKSLYREGVIVFSAQEKKHW